MMNLFEQLIEQVLDEKTIRVKHMKAKAKKKAKLFRIKNKNKLKLRRKKLAKKLKVKPKKKGFSYGADGKIHKVVRRKGVRKPH
jgi:prolyl-tRNA synthetase